MKNKKELSKDDILNRIKTSSNYSFEVHCRNADASITVSNPQFNILEIDGKMKLAVLYDVTSKQVSDQLNLKQNEN